MAEKVETPEEALRFWEMAENNQVPTSSRLEASLRALRFYSAQFISMERQTKAAEFIWVWSPQHGAQLWSGLGPIVTEHGLATALDRVNPDGRRKSGHIYFLAPLAPGERNE